MTLQIARLSTRIRPPDPDTGAAVAGHVRQALAGPLPSALEGAAARALARVGADPDSFLVVRRLDLRLQARSGIDGADLAQGWAAALEEALVRLLHRLQEGAPGAIAEGVQLADRWAAERLYLVGLAAGEPPWWAHHLAHAAGQAAPTPAELILGWVAQQPARAICELAQLTHSCPASAALLSAAEARALSDALLAQLPAGERPSPAATASVAGGPAPPQQGQPATTDPLAPWRQLLAATTAQLPPQLTTEQRAPWLLVRLLTQAPTLTRLGRERLGALLHPPCQPPPGAPLTPQLATGASPGGEPPRGAPTSAAPTAAAAVPSAVNDGQTSPLADPHPEPAATWVGGLLLLIRPLIRLDLLPAGPAAGPLLGDLALCALHRVFSPLPAAERAAALERERPLLTLFAPEREWGGAIRQLTPQDPAADPLLDQLVAQIPPEIAEAPASRQLYGRHPLAFASEPERRLARLVARPGHLLLSAWSAELIWPLSAIDLALRRAGWDQDPGWVPWLGRVIRFRFGEPA